MMNGGRSVAAFFCRALLILVYENILYNGYLVYLRCKNRRV